MISKKTLMKWRLWYWHNFKKGRVIVARDVSGSMMYGDYMLERMAETIKDLQTIAPTLVIVDFDHEIEDIIPIKPGDDIPEPKGGYGGTNYQRLMEFVDAQVCPGVIIISDGYGPMDIPRKTPAVLFCPEEHYQSTNLSFLWHFVFD